MKLKSIGRGNDFSQISAKRIKCNRTTLSRLSKCNGYVYTQVNVTETNVEKVAEDLAVLTSKSETLDEDSLENVASVLSSVVAITSDAENITEENIAEVWRLYSLC